MQPSQTIKFILIFGIVYAVSVYLFGTDEWLGAVIGLVVAGWGVLQTTANKFSFLSGKGYENVVATNCNIAINLKINIAEILQHPDTDGLFEQSKQYKSIKVKNKEEWVDLPVNNYKQKYSKSNIGDRVVKDVRYVWEQVNFNIKNNILWMNKEVSFDDVIYHEIAIPYEYKKEDEETFLDEGIEIRAFVVNGILKIQVGRFGKDTSPNILKENGLAVYQEWATITSFPLMYTQFSLPTHYLNLSMRATESYSRLRGEEASGDFTEDWKKISAETAEYNHLVSSLTDDSSSDRKGVGILKKFFEKRDEWLKREGFADPNEREGDDWPVPPWMERSSTDYLNKYLAVSIVDYNELNEKRERYAYSDYYEEYP